MLAGKIIRYLPHILSCLLLFSSGIAWSQVQYTLSTSGGGTVCDATVTLNLNGTLNGKNRYTANVGGNSVEISWQTGPDQWELLVNGITCFTNSTDGGPDPPCVGIGTWLNVQTFCPGTWSMSASSQYCYPYVSYVTDCGGGSTTVDLFFYGPYNGKYAFIRTAGNTYAVYWQVSTSPARWELSDISSGTVFFYNEADTDPFPPDEQTGTWVGVGACAGSDITGSDGDVLPVELLSFDVTTDAEAFRAEWVTASELNNERFEIEYSLSGKQWHYIKAVDGHGTTEKMIRYSTDFSLPGTSKVVYVRLVQYDYDGASEVFDPLRVEVNPTFSNKVVIYPNPSSGSIRLYGLSRGAIYIYNPAGVPVLVVPEAVPGASIDISDLPAGAYLVKIISGDQVVHRKLIVR